MIRSGGIIPTAVLSIVMFVTTGPFASAQGATRSAIDKTGRPPLLNIRLKAGFYSMGDQWCWFATFLRGPTRRILYVGASGPAICRIHDSLPVPHMLVCPPSWRRPDLGFPAAASTGDGKTLAALVWKQTGTRRAEYFSPRIGIWNLKTGQPVRRLRIRYIGAVSSMAFSAGGRKLAVGGRLYPSKCSVFVIAMKTGTVENRLMLPVPLSRKIVGRVSGLVFGPGGSVLAIIGRWFCRWQLPSGRLAYAVKAERHDRVRILRPLVLLPGGRYAISADMDRARLRWFSTATGKVVRRVRLHFPGALGYLRHHGIWGIATLDQGKYLTCAVSRDFDILMRGRVVVINPKTGNVLAASRVATGCFWGIAAARDGRRLATFGFLGVRLWDLPRMFWVKRKGLLAPTIPSAKVPGK